MKVKILVLISSVLLSLSSYCQSKEAIAKEINDMANSCIIPEQNFKIDSFGNITLGIGDELKFKFNLSDLDTIQISSPSSETSIGFSCKSCITYKGSAKDNKIAKVYLMLTSAAMTKKILPKIKELQKLNQ